MIHEVKNNIVEVWLLKLLMKLSMLKFLPAVGVHPEGNLKLLKIPTCLSFCQMDLICLSNQYIFVKVSQGGLWLSVGQNVRPLPRQLTWFKSSIC